MHDARKVLTHHLERDAYLYIRQASKKQVFESVESTKRQYELRARAAALGWADERIIVIDSDPVSPAPRRLAEKVFASS
jgi:hypothetical protein